MALDKPNQRLMSLYIPHEEKGTLRSVLVVDQNFLLGDGSLNQDSNGELIENAAFNLTLAIISSHAGICTKTALNLIDNSSW